MLAFNNITLKKINYVFEKQILTIKIQLINVSILQYNFNENKICF